MELSRFQDPAHDKNHHLCRESKAILAIAAMALKRFPEHIVPSVFGDGGECNGQSKASEKSHK